MERRQVLGIAILVGGLGISGNGMAAFIDQNSQSIAELNLNPDYIRVSSLERIGNDLSITREALDFISSPTSPGHIPQSIEAARALDDIIKRLGEEPRTREEELHQTLARAQVMVTHENDRPQVVFLYQSQREAISDAIQKANEARRGYLGQPEVAALEAKRDWSIAGFMASFAAVYGSMMGGAVFFNTKTQKSSCFFE